MGNICGKTESDNFSQPGRVVGSRPAQASTAPVPKTVKVGGPARTLGERSVTASEPGDARRRAAEAAEARAQAANKKGGKLQQQLAAQKKQTRSGTLREASKQEVQARRADENAADIRNWD
ncbi:hypothetical protein VHEMI03981 [[Torrubiella] hemipterigena]|uniref:Uncharacterized protein n=1 Tax=[Torrubiella] hemipterigena TaxID=1531966 RepID=A0A0A1SU08_9HYPO|nr:hypothetical protein VHEMI03981 [[Torrubiella] hemipterigena]